MSDSADTSLKILIEGDASGAVAASGEAKDALTGVAGATDVGTEATKQSSAANADEIEGTTKLTFGKHELRGAVRLLGHEFGVFGQLTHFLFSPTGILLGGVLLLTRFMGFAREKTKELTDAIKEMGVSLRQIEQIENPVAKVDVDALGQAAINSQKLADAQKNAVTYSDQLKTAMDGQLAVLNAKAKAEADELKALEENEIARYRAKAAASGESPEAQKMGEEQIRSRYQNLGEGNSAFAEHQRIQLLEKQLADLKKSETLDFTAAESATSAKNRLPLTDTAAERAGRIKSEQEIIAGLTSDRDASPFTTNKNKDYWRDLDNQIHERQKGVDAMIPAFLNQTKLETETNAEYERSMKQLIENTKRRADLEKQIGTGHDVEDIKNNSMFKVQGMRRDTAGGVDIQAKETAQALREAAVSFRIFGDETKLAAVAIRIEADKATGNVKDLNAALDWKARLEADLKTLGRIVANQRSLF